MKSIYKTVLFSLFTLVLGSCAEDPMNMEQYKKEVYLVGAYDRLWKIDVKYSNEPTQDFFTVTTSGTLNLDQDVTVKAQINDELVDIYNRKYIGYIDQDKYFEALNQELYSIPGLERITIDHTKGFSVNVPIYITSKELNPDARYAIPVQIIEAAPYPVSESGMKMLIQINLTNNYSGSYQVEGYTTDLNGQMNRIQKVKIVKAIGVNTVRMFYGLQNESETMPNKRAKTIQLTVLDEFVEGSTTSKKVSVAGWGDLVVTDFGKSSYNTINNTFDISYQTSDGVIYKEVMVLQKPLV